MCLQKIRLANEILTTALSEVSAKMTEHEGYQKESYLNCVIQSWQNTTFMLRGQYESILEQKRQLVSLLIKQD
jgi:hypothetical protein